MGSCFSCCRRRNQRTDDPEREPLLQHKDPYAPRPRSSIEHLVDAIAAYNSGKLPTQDQINRLLEITLRSRILDGEVTGYGPLSARGRSVLQGARQLLHAALQFGREKNADNVVQDFIFQTQHTDPIPIRIAADGSIDALNESISGVQAKLPTLPTNLELSHDSSNLLTSLTSLTRLFITSSAFRLILSDLTRTARHLVTEVASQVEDVAQGIRGAAVDIQKVAQFGDGSIERAQVVGEELKRDVTSAVFEAAINVERAESDSIEAVRDAVVGRLQEVIILANRNPEYQHALWTILTILRKYTSKLCASADALADVPGTLDAAEAGSIPAPSIELDENLDQAMSSLRVILERLAGNHSLQPVISSFAKAIGDLVGPSTSNTNLDDVHLYLTRVRAFLDAALSHSEYITSRSGMRALERLHDEFRALLAQEANSTWARDVRAFVDECNLFIQAMEDDAQTKNLLAALDALVTHLSEFGNDAVGMGMQGARRWREEVVKDLIGWVLPRVVSALGAVPMPRVEFSNNTVDVAIDALLLGASGVSASLMPDRLGVQSCSDIVVEMTDPHLEAAGAVESALTLMEPRVRSENRIKINVEGVRVSAQDIGYFVRWKGFPGWGIGYEDEGLMSTDVGGGAGEGIQVMVELEMDTDTSSTTCTSDRRQRTSESPGNSSAAEAEPPPLFRVLNVHTSISGLTISLHRSKHWIFNKLILQPLLSPIVRRVAAGVVEAQVRRVLEGIAEVLGGAVEDAEREAGTDLRKGSVSLVDYCRAVLGRLAATVSSNESLPPDVHVTSSTKATLKGIVHTTTTTTNFADAPDDSRVDPGYEGLESPRNTSLDMAETEETSTTIAVGAGAQLFPGKGGPYDPQAHEDSQPQSPSRIAREGLGLDEVRQAAAAAAAATGQTLAAGEAVSGIMDSGPGDIGEAAMRQAVRTREVVEHASERMEERERVESRNEGWRSGAFDLG